MVLTMSRASSRLSEVALILMILFPDEVDVEILDRRFSRTIRIFSLEGRVSSGVSWGTSESFFAARKRTGKLVMTLVCVSILSQVSYIADSIPSPITLFRSTFTVDEASYIGTFIRANMMLNKTPHTMVSKTI